MRQIIYARDALKTLRSIDNATAKRIQVKVAQYADDPASLANQVKRLKGEDRLWRLRVGDWRVIFNEDRVVVHIVQIAPRGSAYD
ncbi:type II toxin-antitoxin system RelE/ParE family toxin [Blastomonas sp. AAP53]|uniref:type II toxin-antitoxin system RelE family toxin n=1 Tax=Blastomonas sp. AAP53 TaxID=1248760 RepID=UPI0002F9C5EE|nr:type II toxin-antitoxin system RelE/ParE family toxin [Blastomonas sp. AAP53]